MNKSSSRFKTWSERTLSLLSCLFLFGTLPILVVLHYEFGLLANFLPIFTSQISQMLISSFAGSAGGAGLIYYLDVQNKKRDFLRAINTSLALMAGHTSTLINYKSQHLLPLKKEKDAILTYMQTVITLRQANPNVEIDTVPVESRYLFQQLPIPQNEFVLDYAGLSEYSEKFPMAMVYLVKAKEGMGAFKSLTQDYRDILSEIRTTVYEPEGSKLAIIMGKAKMNSMFDERLPNIIDNMLLEADNALFFLRKATEDLQSKGEKLLPKDVSKRLAKSATKEGYEIYMPPRDLVKGWED